MQDGMGCRGRRACGRGRSDDAQRSSGLCGHTNYIVYHVGREEMSGSRKRKECMKLSVVFLSLPRSLPASFFSPCSKFEDRKSEARARSEGGKERERKAERIFRRRHGYRRPRRRRRAAHDTRAAVAADAAVAVATDSLIPHSRRCTAEEREAGRGARIELRE